MIQKFINYIFKLRCQCCNKIIGTDEFKHLVENINAEVILCSKCKMDPNSKKIFDIVAFSGLKVSTPQNNVVVESPWFKFGLLI